MDSSSTGLLDKRPKGRGDVLCREMDDGVILYDPVEGKVHSLNPVAAYIWDALDGKQSLADISEGLLAISKIDPKDIAGDVEQAVDTFIKEGLLESPVGSRE